MDDFTLDQLRPVAATIVAALRSAGFPAESAITRNVLNLAEETGEVVGAYRRWSGQARRSGTLTELGAELADVAITAHVAAHEMGIDLTTGMWPRAQSRAGVEDWVMMLFVRAGSFVSDYQDRCQARAALDWVVLAVRQIADLVGIDLEAATCYPVTRGVTLASAPRKLHRDKAIT